MNAAMIRMHVLTNPEKANFAKYVPLAEQLSNADLESAIKTNSYTARAIGEAFANREYERMDNLILSMIVKAADAAGVSYDMYALV